MANSIPCRSRKLFILYIAESFTSGADVSLDGDQEELSSNMKENPVGKFMIALMAFPKLVRASHHVILFV